MKNKFKTGGYCPSCLNTKTKCTCLKKQLDIAMNNSTPNKPKSIRHCVCCNAELEELYDDHTSKAWSGMWLNGIVDKISANYGSSHDGDVYIIGICDDCITSKVKDGIIEYAYSYM